MRSRRGCSALRTHHLCHTAPPCHFTRAAAHPRPRATPTQALRLFVGVPVWTPVNRPADNNPSRAKYLSSVGRSAVAAA